MYANKNILQLISNKDLLEIFFFIIEIYKTVFQHKQFYIGY